MKLSKMKLTDLISALPWNGASCSWAKAKTRLSYDASAKKMKSGSANRIRSGRMLI